MSAWDDETLSRFAKRVVIFTRRGWTHERAEAFAERLVRRDRELDERRACIECKHLQRSGSCIAYERSTPSTRAAMAHPPLRSPFRDETLQHCTTFDWST